MSLAMYSGVRKIFRVYWVAYGGLKAMLRSPYLHLAGVLLLLTFNTWTSPQWWETSIAVLPNLLGFTLGGFAIFIGFGDERFRAMLADPDTESENRPSIYVSLCATFVHFILVQFLALAAALLAKSWWFYAAWMDAVRPALPYLNGAAGAIGYFIFLYALTSVVAATMHVLRIATMYEAHRKAAQRGCT
jgi:hypothetical protein